MIRTLLIALLASCTLARTPADLTISNAPSCPADIAFATTIHSAGFTIHAPQPPGWSTRPVEGGGLVLHRFETIEGADPPFGMATVTVATFSPAKTADTASNTLQILRPTNPTGNEHVPRGTDLRQHRPPHHPNHRRLPPRLPGIRLSGGQQVLPHSNSHPNPRRRCRPLSGRPGRDSERCADQRSVVIFHDAPGTRAPDEFEAVRRSCS